jgi:hypothetical protein
MPPFVPPPASELEAATQETITELAAGLANPGPWLKSREGEILGIGAIIAEQFPDVPASVLGRILVSASMALGAICRASDMTGAPLAPRDLTSYLGYAAAISPEPGARWPRCTVSLLPELRRLRR